MIDPRQGYLTSWNNVPSAGWTNGDGEARERLTGPYHRNAYLERLVARVRRRPSYEASRSVDRSSGAVAQQRPLAGRALRAARRVARGAARATLDAVIRWDGNYARTDAAGTVDPGVAIWEELKSQAKDLALRPLGGAAATRSPARPGTRTRSTSRTGRRTRCVASDLVPCARPRRARRPPSRRRFATADIARWREPRRKYDVAVQGAAAEPILPFFDRGTFQESIALGP